MRIADFMTRDPVTTSPETAVGDAIRVMVLKGFRHLPVVDPDHNLLGIVTERDLRGVDQHVKVISCMADNPITATGDQTLADATKQLAEQGVGCLPVVTGPDDHKLVGILTSGDLLRMHRDAQRVLDVARVLVPLDLEDAAYEALMRVNRLFPQADVTAVYVLPDESPASPGSLLGDTTDETRLQTARKSLRALLDERSLPGVEVMIAMGTPHVRIVAVAELLDVDLVVIPPHNKGPLERLFMGSVTSKVVGAAPCPVLVMRGRVPRGWLWSGPAS